MNASVKQDQEWEAALEQLHEDMEKAHLVPTWKYVSQFVSITPKVTYQPFLWHWDNVLHHLYRAGELITPQRGAERRSMEHTNPDLRAWFATTHTMATAFQLVKAGESAPSHRHMAAAIRFACRSSGGEVFTRVQGEPLLMEENDLVLTPSGTWHEHRNATGQDIVWMDALDYPLVNLLQASWFEPGDSPESCPPKRVNFTNDHLGTARPVGWGGYPEKTPLMRYPWREMKPALDRLRGEPGSPFDGILLEYVDPLTLGSTLPTISCRAQLLRSAEHTKAHRASASSIYYAIDGDGSTVIDGIRFDWHKGDVFMIPPWAWHEHISSPDRDCYLFSVTDQPVMEKLGMYREQAYMEPGGHQKIDGRFQG